ncbi:MAG: helix-turn-helix transcriptional regulator [bacterium]|nr:helix-turn-helix transcriptional regulator [bacterium]
MEIGKTLKIFRHTVGMRQAELSRLTDVSVNYISMVENGRREPSIKFIKRAADVFNIPAGAFFWNVDEFSKSDDAEFANVANSLQELYWSIIKSRLSKFNSTSSETHEEK